MRLTDADQIQLNMEYFEFIENGDCDTHEAISHCIDIVRAAEEIRSPNLWIDALQSSFDVSRRTAKDMYHALCVHKARDNFRKQFDI